MRGADRGRSCTSRGYDYFHSKVKIFVQSLVLPFNSFKHVGCCTRAAIVTLKKGASKLWKQ